MRSPPEEPAEAAQAEVTTAQAEAAAKQRTALHANAIAVERDAIALINICKQLWSLVPPIGRQ
ncbi:hypothetical protein [Coleofasciculus sp. FACHB-542]|uniref:hypothetical protein n=1 Tax=Coleofasciculus sp. FACHB-542 TaxID=2692787 RepID=UPI001688511D|nr:hypothetical protein [Coleofasciculus sp. FACHB-542]MBD2084028.1 hypothetical protein [Coleofasciculus sp. FACHB-542]